MLSQNLSDFLRLHQQQLNSWCDYGQTVLGFEARPKLAMSSRLPDPGERSIYGYAAGICKLLERGVIC